MLTEKFFISSERSFNKIFRKDVTFDNIKSHKKQGFTLSLENTFFGKPQGGPPAVLGLIKTRLNPRWKISHT